MVQHGATVVPTDLDVQRIEALGATVSALSLRSCDSPASVYFLA